MSMDSARSYVQRLRSDDEFRCRMERISDDKRDETLAAEGYQFTRCELNRALAEDCAAAEQAAAAEADREAPTGEFRRCPGCHQGDLPPLPTDGEI